MLETRTPGARRRPGLLRMRSLGAAGAAVIAAVVISACGSSSSNKTTTTKPSAANAAATSTAAAATPAAPAAVPTSAVSGSTGLPLSSWCGSKSITLGYFDGNGANAWSQESLAVAKKVAAECPSIKKVITATADLNLQKATTGLASLVAQGANAIAMVPDLGSAELPGITQATQHGVKVVTWAVNPGGSTPADYVAFLNYNTVHNGQEWGQWLGKALHGHGNVVYLGGPPANPIDTDQLTGLFQGLKSFPGVKVLTGTSTSTWPVTNWDPSMAQTVMAGLLSKFSGTKINAIVTGDGQSTLGALAAFKDAGAHLPDVAGQESNGLACAWKDAQGTSNAFQLATSSNRNWMAGLAVMKAVAAANGLSLNKVPNIFNLPLYEDSVAGGDLTPHCDTSLPMSDLTSSILKPLSFWLAQ